MYNRRQKLVNLRAGAAALALPLSLLLPAAFWLGRDWLPVAALVAVALLVILLVVPAGPSR